MKTVLCMELQHFRATSCKGLQFPTIVQCSCTDFSRCVCMMFDMPNCPTCAIIDNTFTFVFVFDLSFGQTIPLDQLIVNKIFTFTCIFNVHSLIKCAVLHFVPFDCQSAGLIAVGAVLPFVQICYSTLDKWTQPKPSCCSFIQHLSGQPASEKTGLLDERIKRGSFNVCTNPSCSLRNTTKYEDVN